MTRHVAIGRRTTAVALALWSVSLAWLVWGPHTPGIHRTLVTAAGAFTVIAVLERRLVSMTETARLATEAAYRQAQADQRAER